MTITLSALQKQRYDTAANWTAENPTLLAGEIGVESDTGKIKIGTGATAWTSLSYSGLIPGSGVYPYSQLLMPSGTAGAPSISFDGDGDSGIYRSGANAVAISTNGAGRLFVDSTGIITTDNGFTSSRFNVVNTNTVSTYDRMLLFRSNNLSNGHIGLGSDSFYIASASNAPLVFCTNSDGGVSGSSVPTNERLRITSDGKLGLGTSSPAASSKLDVTGGDLIVSPNTAGKNTITLTTNAADDGRLLIKSDTTTKVDIQANGTSYFNGGNVGIGTTSPSSNLHIESNNYPTIRLKDSTEGGFALIEVSPGGGMRFRADPGNEGTTAEFIRFDTAASERARIDSSGRLLVGTSTSIANRINGNLQIVGTGEDACAHLTRYSAAQDGAPIFIIGRSRSATKGTNTIVTSGDKLGAVEFTGADGSSFIPGAAIEGYVDGTPGVGDMPGRLVFSTTADGASSPTERMRISSDGTHEFFGSGNAVIRSASSSAAGTSNVVFTGRYGATSTTTGTDSCYIFTNGNIQNTNNSYGAISDIKLKENIVDASSQWDDLKDLRVVNYNFKEGQTHTQIGLIAQEVELVSPGLVSESPDRDEDGTDLGTVTKSVNYSVLYMKAVKALQEAMERIEVLEAKVNALEGN